jgi:hypothetical protein
MQHIIVLIKWRTTLPSPSSSPPRILHSWANKVCSCSVQVFTKPRFKLSYVIWAQVRPLCWSSNESSRWSTARLKSESKRSYITLSDLEFIKALLLSIWAFYCCIISSSIFAALRRSASATSGPTPLLMFYELLLIYGTCLPPSATSLSLK